MPPLASDIRPARCSDLVENLWTSRALLMENLLQIPHSEKWKALQDNILQPPAFSFLGHPPDMRSHTGEALHQVLISTFDLIDIVDHTLSLRAQRGDHHRHAGANIW